MTTIEEIEAEAAAEAAEELDVKPDDFDSSVAASLADAAAAAPRYGVTAAGSDDDAPEELTFEGRAVNKTEVKISGLTGLSDAYTGLKIGIDDRVRMVVEARATKVNHYTNTDGDLVRSQELKVFAAEIIPWDPTDPNDDGILRA